eukprot:GHVO01004218.1.p1 GENE.GHVO01004218.1~~GHVO01004218.1.p1  ORF type:complete len:550 (-),score=74.23 GHVO01004218.1:1348-2997(-)
MVSCMPASMLHQIAHSIEDIQPCKTTLRGASGTDLKCLGTIQTNVTCNRRKENATFYINQLGKELILGLEFCRRFDLIKIADECIQRPITIGAVHSLDEKDFIYSPLKRKWAKYLPLGKKTGDALEDLKLIFPSMFDGRVGKFEGEANLCLTPDAKPVQLPPRAVPQSILPKLKKELDKMEKEGIIRPCPETTEWVHNIVTVVKKNGSLRVCLDPRNLNRYLTRNVHYTASWEDVQHSFRHGTVFSTLDAKSGYWAQQLSKDSQPLTAFNTPFQKYCFMRLPFGLSVSSEIFCRQMDKTLQGIPGTFPCADDVKVQGSTEEHHDLHLLETVHRAKQAGLKFNPDKCAIKKRKIDYFGRIISADGVEPCSKKVKAIMDLAAPKDKQELQSFLGMANYLSAFIPNLTKNTHLMRALLKKDVHFKWTSDMTNEMDIVKETIAKAIRLTHYDPNQPITIETDASLKGLGAALIQDGKPVRFISKALTTAESNYANIERELLAILFACERLHIYTYGRKVVIHTDHKPLMSIFSEANQPGTSSSPKNATEIEDI